MLRRSGRAVVSVAELNRKMESRKSFNFEYLNNILNKIEKLENQRENLNLFRNLTKIGFYNERISLKLLSSILELDLNNLNSLEIIELIEILNKQRIKDPEVISFMIRGREFTSGYEQVKLIKHLANLNLIQLSGSFPIPSNPRLALDIAYSLTLAGDKIESHVIPCLEVMTDSDQEWGLEDCKKIRIIFHYLKFIKNFELNLKISKFLSKNSTKSENSILNPKRKISPNLKFISSISEILFKSKIPHSIHVEKGPFLLDILERDRKVVWECNRPNRFYVGTNEKTAYYNLQEKILKSMGFKIVQIPFYHWSRMTNRKMRMDYVQMNRHLAITDIRENRTRNESFEDPSKFDAKTAAMENGNYGEYFFHKEQPRRHWSWHKPSNIRITL
jgi:hypothetical protein